jgi:hypothetical protein
LWHPLERDLQMRLLKNREMKMSSSVILIWLRSNLFANSLLKLSSVSLDLTFSLITPDVLPPRKSWRKTD